MSTIPEELLYTDDHEWARRDEADPDVVTVGITDYAQDKLGDIVMVELPEVDDALDAHAVFGAVESPKSVSDLFLPVSGTIVAVNEALEDEPELVNTDPYGDGWIVRVKLADTAQLDGLMDAAAYAAHVAAAEDA